MTEKNLKTRIIHKHDTADNWAKAISFIPKQGEIIVYDIDETHSYERFKIGDGVTNVDALPFAYYTKAEMDDKLKNLSTDFAETLATEILTQDAVILAEAQAFAEDKVKVLANGAVADNTVNIEALFEMLTWGSF